MPQHYFGHFRAARSRAGFSHTASPIFTLPPRIDAFTRFAIATMDYDTSRVTTASATPALRGRHRLAGSFAMRITRMGTPIMPLCLGAEMLIIARRTLLFFTRERWAHFTPSTYHAPFLHDA